MPKKIIAEKEVVNFVTAASKAIAEKWVVRYQQNGIWFEDGPFDSKYEANLHVVRCEYQNNKIPFQVTQLTGASM